MCITKRNLCIYVKTYAEANLCRMRTEMFITKTTLYITKTNLCITKTNMCVTKTTSLVQHYVLKRQIVYNKNNTV
jgi:hypothetical protein